MPELPEVETVCKGLRRAMLGRRFATVTARRGDLRFPLPKGFSARLKGAKIENIDRRGKYIVVNLSGGLVLLMHLGMTGRFTIAPSQSGKPSSRARYGEHDHVAFVLDDGTRIIFTDPRRFGMMDIVTAGALGRHRLFRHLGIEPLSDEFDATCLAQLFDRRRTTVKVALLNQKNIAGLGNIYACEALFRAGLSPKRQAYTLVRNHKPDRRLSLLAKSVREVLVEAIAAGGSTLRDYSQADGSLGNFQSRFQVYDRENSKCLKFGCRGTIRRLVQAGRSTFYCPTCQR